MVIGDASTREQVVMFLVEKGDPMSIRLSEAIMIPRRERGLLGLWNLCRIPENLTAGCLIKSYVGFRCADCLQESCDPEGDGFNC